MRRIQPVRGTHDLAADEMRRHRHVVEHARTLAARYGFAEVATPIFEFSDVFRRTLGDTSDIVTKEMYTFTDRGGSELTLRPENTAGVARAVIGGTMGARRPFRCFYAGPMFRYERPQKGRLRQFHQIGVELIGAAEPLADIEVIACGAHLLEALGVLDRVTLEINTLADEESRRAYRAALVAHLEANEDALSEESRQRLRRNPLRVLDSKDEGDRAVLADAPVIDAHLSPDAAAFFDTVCEGLAGIGVAFTRNARLVRGLDYYCHTAFEFTTEALGAQGAVLAGGRYDGLIETMGGPPTPGVGWAGGIERLAALVAETGAVEALPRPIAIVPLGARAEAAALGLAQRLRHEGFAVELTYRGTLSKRMKRANQAQAAAAIILGDDELDRGVATVRDLDSGEQVEAPEAGLSAHLARYAPGR